MRLIDRHALRFVDGRGIAMIDMGIVLEVERDLSAIVEPHRHAVGRHRSICPACRSSRQARARSSGT
jgi:hypothetical protein